MNGDRQVDRASQLRWLAVILAAAIGFVVVLLVSAGSHDGGGEGTRLSKSERQQRETRRQSLGRPYAGNNRHLDVRNRRA